MSRILRYLNAFRDIFFHKVIKICYTDEKLKSDHPSDSEESVVKRIYIDEKNAYDMFRD